MSEESVIQVNFGRHLPIFPLHDIVLMPHGILPLHIFEDRYRQMVGDALDGAGQIAMAVFEGDAWRQEYHGRPPIRPIVCVGQIVQHHRMPDGRYTILLRGVCRAKILYELPASTECLYRQAMLDPIGIDEMDESPLAPFRQRLVSMLSDGPLTDLREGATVLEHVKENAIPTQAIIELVAMSFISDPEVRYRVLAAADPMERARIVEGELNGLAALIRRTAAQRRVETPKGCSWN